MGNVGVIQDGERLPFGLEASDNLLRVHAELDNFQGDAALDRFALLGKVDDRHTALAEHVQNTVRPDLRRVLVGVVLCLVAAAHTATIINASSPVRTGSC